MNEGSQAVTYWVGTRDKQRGPDLQAANRGRDLLYEMAVDIPTLYHFIAEGR